MSNLFGIQKIGVGTPSPLGALDVRGGDIIVGGNILPLSNEVYDLGSSNARFRDLFLSGNTIDMAGLLLTKNTGGSLEVRDRTTNSLQRLVVDEIQIGSSNDYVAIKKDAENKGVKIQRVQGQEQGASQEASIVPNLYSANSNIGIGKATPEVPLDVVGNMRIAGHILPASNVVYDLGSSNMRFRDLYLSGNTINIGSNSIGVNENGHIDVGSNVFAINILGVNANVTNVSSTNVNATNVTATNATISSLVCATGAAGSIAVTGTLDAKLDSDLVQIGHSNAQIVNIGTSSRTQIVNIGTGSGGTTINIGGAGDTVNIAGMVAQTASSSSNATGADNYTYKNITTQNVYSNVGNTDVELTEFAMTITPTSANAEIELKYMIHGESQHDLVFQLYRNGVKIGSPGASIWQGTASMMMDPDTGSTMSLININYVDSPATTAPCTYKLMIRSSITNATVTFSLNRGRVNAGTDGYENAVSHAFARQLGGAITVAQAFQYSNNIAFLPSGSNLGIGKSNPTYALDVVGDVNFTGQLRSNGQLLSLVGGGGGGSNATGADNYVYKNVTSSAVYTMVNTTEQTINEFTITITPTSVNAEIELSYMINCEYNWDSVFQLYRNGVKIGNHATNNGQQWAGTAPIEYDNNNDSTMTQVIIHYVDAPNTTSPVTYTLAARNSFNTTGTFNLTINRTNGNAGQNGYENAISTVFARQLGGSITVSQAFQYSNNIAFLPSGSNLGIGKSNAAYALDVVGDVNVSGNFKVNGSNLSLGGYLGSGAVAPQFIRLVPTVSYINANDYVTKASNCSVSSDSTMSLSGNGVTVTVPGLYKVSGYFNTATGDCYVYVYKVSGGVSTFMGASWVSTNNASGALSTVFQCAAGDSIQILVPSSSVSLFTAARISGVVYASAFDICLVGTTSSQFSTSNATDVILPAGSNLGIGKSNPSYALDVVGDINFSGQLRSNGSLLSVGSTYTPLRYIRWSVNGNTVNSGNHYVEFQAFDTLFNNVALGKTVTAVTGTQTGAHAISVITNGNITSANEYYETQAGASAVQIDLGAIYTNVASFRLWMYYVDGRSYNNVKLEISTDGATWNTLLNPQTVIAAGYVVSVPLVSYANPSSQLLTSTSSTVFLPTGSNLGIGKSNPAYALDVVGDVNFTGQLRANGNVYSPSQFTTNGANVTLTGSNLVVDNNVAIVANSGFGGGLYGAFQIKPTAANTNYVSMGFTNGTATTDNNLETLNITRVGRVGIGKTQPLYTMDVQGAAPLIAEFRSSSAIVGENSALAVGSTASTVNAIYMGYTTEGGGRCMIGRRDTAQVISFSSSGSGNIRFHGFSSGTLSTDSSGNISSSSDSRVKQNIEYLTSNASLDIVNQLKPASFELLSDVGRKRLGFIAQDVEQVIPDAVDGKKFDKWYKTKINGEPELDEAGNLIFEENAPIRPRSLDTTAILAHAVAAIQQLSAKLDAAYERIAQLESQ